MGVKTLSAWTVLVALAGGAAMAQDDGWAKRTGPRALPPADPDDGFEIFVPAAPAMPPMPEIPPVPGGPGGDALPPPRVVGGAPLPCDTPVAEVLAPQWKGLSAGVGFSLLRPYVTNNPAFTVVNGAASGTASFGWDPEAAVQFWVSYDDPSGFGGRVRTFVFDAESPLLTARLTGPGPVVTLPAVLPTLAGAGGFAVPSPVLMAAGLGEDRLAFQSDLRIVSTDVEGTYGWMNDDCSVQVSAGLRYLQLRQGYGASLVNLGDGATFITEEFRVRREFEGCGPTAALVARQRICQTPFAVYLGARCAVVVGTVETTSTFTQLINDPTLAAGTGTQRTRTGFASRADATVPVTELELGVEYGKLAGQYGLFVRAGVVAQTYFDAGGAASPLGNLTLFGGQLAFGVAY